ncbi:MAG: SDR family oxidoreductase [Victivallales bacterium]|nr:SDR family oxidoreductase [Victivallales bacterium]
MTEMTGKKALVTGGAGGYGFGIANALSKAGAEVWITGRNQAKLETASAKIGAHPVRADVCNGADWDSVFDKMGGDVDILVNNAGAGGAIVPVAEQRDEDIIATISTNLTGCILGCARAARLMKERCRGDIINISSVCALYAWPAWSVYTAAKAGLAKFSHGLYTEMRPYGVRVSCLTPSWGQTDFNKAAGIQGASESELASKCTSPEQLGAVVLSILQTPPNLAIPDMTVLPLIQDIQPM